jgi:hypothetical protein
MSNFQRLLNMASKALGDNGQSSSSGTGKTDWRDIVRTAADKVTGDSRPADTNRSYTSQAPAAGQYNTARPSAARAGADRTTTGRPASPVSHEDAAAIARYDYLLKTAQPEQLEQVHRDAFERLTPAQRELVDAQLRADLPAHEQPASSNPADLARAAARGEAHNPGFLRRMFAKPGVRGAGGALAGAGVGAVAGVGIGAAGGLLAAVAGGAVLSNVAGPLLEQAAGFGVDFDSIAGGIEGFGLEAGDFASGLSEQASGLGEQVSGLGEQASGLGEQASEFGSNFEIPGLDGLRDLFGR